MSRFKINSGWIGDVFALYIGLGLKLLAGILCVGFAARKLGISEFALLAKLQAVDLFVFQIAEYGYGVVGTRIISQVRATDQYSRRLTELLCWKGIAALIGLAVGAFFLHMLIPGQLLLQSLVIMVALFRGAMLGWLLYGVERFIVVNIIESVSAIVGVVLVYALLPEFRLLGFYASMFLAGLAAMAFFLMVSSRHLHFSPVSVRSVFRVGRECGAMFLVRLYGTAFAAGSSWLYGLFATDVHVAGFSGAEKIVTFTRMGFMPVIQKVFPSFAATWHLQPKESKKAESYIWILSVGVSIVLAAGIYTFREPLAVLLLGSEVGKVTSGYLGVAIWLLPVMVYNAVVGQLFLLARGRDRAFMLLGFGATVFTSLGLVVAGIFCEAHGWWATGAALLGGQVMAASVLAYLRCCKEADSGAAI